MSDDTRSSPKAPTEMKWKSYAERKAAEEKIRNERNRKTHQEYRLPPVPPPSQRKSSIPDPVPSAGDGFPTRDQEPVRIPLGRKIQGEYADVISLHDRKKHSAPSKGEED